MERKSLSDNKAALLIIGDEILSGQVTDEHVPFLTRKLGEKGFDICEVRFVQDKFKSIIHSVQELKKLYSWIFTTGGIGSTHDDITQVAIAEALHKKLHHSPVIEEKIREYFPEALNQSLSQTLIPEGAELIDNPVSYVPSFSIDGIYALPGMPNVMRGMVEALLPNLPSWPKKQAVQLRCAVREGKIAQPLGEIQKRYESVSIGSYPYYINEDDCGVTLIARGYDETLLLRVQEEMRSMVNDYGGQVL